MGKLFVVFEVKHLIRSGSDHTPLQLNFSVVRENISKLFRFLNLWINVEGCLEVIKRNWKIKVHGNPFIMFQQKLKQVKVALGK